MRSGGTDMEILLLIALIFSLAALVIPVWFRVAEVRSLVQSDKKLGRHSSLQKFMHDNPEHDGMVLDVFAGNNGGIWWMKVSDLPKMLMTRSRKAACS